MIRKLLRKCVVWIMREEDDDELRNIASAKRRNRLSTVSVSSDTLNTRCMTFNLYAAEGGTVIETAMYSEKEDRTVNRLYLIPDGEDFTSTLGQIVSMERIKSWH